LVARLPDFLYFIELYCRLASGDDSGGVFFTAANYCVLPELVDFSAALF
jgi:hypothetical protein